MRIDVAVRVLPVDERGNVILLSDNLENRMNLIAAKRLARELLIAARRAEKLRQPQKPKSPERSLLNDKT